MLSVTPVTDTLQKPYNTHKHLWDRAKWATMNTEQGLVNFVLPELEKFLCFDTKKGCPTEEQQFSQQFNFLYTLSC